MKRLFSILTALLFTLQLPLAALAVDVDLAYGNVTINDTQVTHSTASESNKTESHGGSVTVKQTNNETATSNTISVTTTTQNVTVVLDNVNVALPAGNVAQSNPMNVEAADGTTVTVELKGDNVLDASTGSFNNNGSAALHKDASGNLVIQDYAGDDKVGSLTATGNMYAAGIGSNYSYSGEDTGNITINSGKIVAESKSNLDYQNSSGAAIGGGSNGAASNIVINGGDVTAKANMGAAIGGGFGGTAENITITDGTVNATSQTGAAIGGGQGKNTSSGTGDDATAKNIAISGGNVTATSTSGAGIGGGSAKGRGENITISGTAVVNATSQTGAGIGGGSQGAGTDISVNGGEVTASSTNGAGIGGGSGGVGTDITISDGKVTAQSGTGAGIGSGASAMHFNQPLNVAINGGTVTASSTDGAAIGGGKQASYYGKAENKVINVDITDGTVNATSTNGAAIGVGSGWSTPVTDIEISGDSQVAATTGTDYAFGKDSQGNAVTFDPNQLSEDGKVILNENGKITEITKPVPEAESVSPDSGEDNIFDAENQQGAVSVTETKRGTVLYVEADGENVSFTANLAQLKTLADKGIETVVFITDTGAAAYSLNALFEALEGNQKVVVTIDGESATLHYGSEEKTDLLLDKAEVEKLVKAK